MGIVPYTDDLPLPPWTLTWRCRAIKSMESLFRPDFLCALMWELSEVVFIYSFIVLNHRIRSMNPSSSVLNIAESREMILMAWHDHLTITPQFEGPRLVESTNVLADRKQQMLPLAEVMEEWPRYPEVLKEKELCFMEDVNQWVDVEETLILFFCQSFADNFSRRPPLPCIRPPLPPL